MKKIGLLACILCSMISCQSFKSSSEDQGEKEAEGQEENYDTVDVLTRFGRAPSLSGVGSASALQELKGNLEARLQSAGKKVNPAIVTLYLMTRRLSGQFSFSPEERARLNQWIFQAQHYPPLLLEVIYLKLMERRFPEVRYYLARLSKMKLSSSIQNAIQHIKILISFEKQDRSFGLSQLKTHNQYRPSGLMLAQEALKAGFWEEALALFRKDPSDSARFGEATALRLLRKPNEALSIYQKMYGKYEGDKRVYLNYLLTLIDLLPGSREDLTNLLQKRGGLRSGGEASGIDEAILKAVELAEKRLRASASPQTSPNTPAPHQETKSDS